MVIQLSTKNLVLIIGKEKKKKKERFFKELEKSHLHILEDIINLVGS